MRANVFDGDGNSLTAYFEWYRIRPDVGWFTWFWCPPTACVFVEFAAIGGAARTFVSAFVASFTVTDELPWHAVQPVRPDTRVVVPSTWTDTFTAVFEKPVP